MSANDPRADLLADATMASPQGAFADGTNLVIASISPETEAIPRASVR